MKPTTASAAASIQPGCSITPITNGERPSFLNQADHDFIYLYDDIKSLLPRTEERDALIDILRAVQRLIHIDMARVMNPTATMVAVEKDMRRLLISGLSRLGLS